MVENGKFGFGKMNSKKMILVLIFISQSACEKHKLHIIQPAFYFWKSTFKLTEVEKKTLSDNNIKRLYIKFFDITWNVQMSKPQIVAPIFFEQKNSLSSKIIPVVFIMNQTFVNLPESKIDTFARSVLDNIVRMSKCKIKELQIDCDWTLSTKHKYFRFLKALKNDSFLLSATIRLHQVKFFEKTGIPPVDRGMLMCYNMSDWQNPKTQNSIFSTKVLSQYIQRLEQYPKPLDMVMPIFHWTVVFRNNHFLFFVNNLGSEELENNSNFIQLADSQLFKVKNDTLFENFSIRKGDIFRCEESNFEEIFNSSEIILDKISNEKLTFALYHLEEKCLSKYSNDQIKTLLHVNETFR
jgi:hypothetical protein